MRYPTDMKLLWESIEWLYRYICRHCVELGIRRPRNKYRNVAESYLSYCKKRKRKASRTRMLKRRMIRLLEKLLIQRDEINREHGASLRYAQDYLKRLSIIRKVLVQEKDYPSFPCHIQDPRTWITLSTSCNYPSFPCHIQGVRGM